MKSFTIKKLYILHSWVGIVTGILLFVIAFTGAVSVFGRPEIKVWANPEVRQAAEIKPQSLEQLIVQHVGDIPASFREEINIFLPRARTFTNLTVIFEDHDNGQAIVKTFDNQSLQLLSTKSGSVRELFEKRETDIADFIVDFHADLHLGSPLGLLLTGLLGLTLTVSIITGFFIHRKKLRNLFTFRWKKSFDVSLTDFHKVLGVWGLLFNGVIAFTGAFLGLATVILIPAAAFVTFSGDQEKLIEMFVTTPEPIMANEFASTKVAKPLAHAQSYDEDMRFELISIYGFEDKNAKVYISGVGSDKVSAQTLSYDGSSGDFTEAFGRFGKLEGVSPVILDLMYPLHFGNFGGPLVKLIWTLLGLTTALLPISGMMLWLHRGEKSSTSNFSSSTYSNVKRLVIGACGGAVFATAALFPAQLVTWSTNPQLSNSVLFGIIFFGSWLLSILLAFCIKNTGLSSKLIAYSTGITLLCVPFLNVLTTGDDIFSLFLLKQWETAITDLTLFTLGALIIFTTKRVSNKSRLESVGNDNNDKGIGNA